MKINKIKINSYGILKDKEINLGDNINIIYGDNEAGKSTLIKFIVNSFYGISKNKKGREFSDFEKYTPWVGEEFSGKLEYELDNKNKYEIFRDFNKKNPKIYNENMEDISKEFNIDKNKGNEFFYEHTKVDEDLFLSTVVINQQEVKLGKQEQNVLIQKIANLVGTGDDSVSYKRAIDRIDRRRLEEIGTERSREKPLNLVEKKIQKLEQEKHNLEKYEETKYEIEENKNKIISEINDLENEYLFLKDIKIVDEKEIIEKEKIRIKENIRNGNIEKINLLKNKIEDIKSEKIIKNNVVVNSRTKNKANKLLVLIFILLIILNFLQFIFINNYYLKYIFLLTIPVFLIFYFIYIKKQKNKLIKEEKNIKGKLYLEINNINNQINILQKNNIEIENETKKMNNDLNLKINLEKEKIKNNYFSKFKNKKINILANTKDINFEIENLQNKINNKKLEMHSLELDKKNIEPQLESLSKIEEELVYNKQKMLSLKNLDKSMELAKEVLFECYQKMKSSVTPRFTANLSNNISEITNGKYKNVIFNDKQGLLVELENGCYEVASKLSVGTIEQLYLSLRLSMVEELSEEKLPIILDEVFAYYDANRLANALKYISEKYKGHQIIILTCTEREKEILTEMNVNINLIML